MQLFFAKIAKTKLQYIARQCRNMQLVLELT